jgi:hypothetical protein
LPAIALWSHCEQLDTSSGHTWLNAQLKEKAAALDNLRVILVLLIGTEEVLWQSRHLSRLCYLRAVFGDKLRVRKTAVDQNRIRGSCREWQHTGNVFVDVTESK